MQAPIFAARKRRASIFGAISVLAIVTACSTDNVLDLRPAVDVGQTAGIVSVTPIPKETFRETDQGTFEAIDPEQDFQSGAQDMPPEEPQDDFAAPTSEPDTDYADDPAGMNGGDPSDDAYVPETGNEAFQPQASIRPLPPKPAIESGFPRITPRAEPSVSADEVACRKELKRAGVRYEDLAPIRDSKTCYIDNPVKVSAIGNIQMKPAATLTCRMALTFAKWTNKELSPSVRWRFFTGVKTIRQGSSYSCRRIAGSGTPSAHSKGNALDLMSIEFNNGKSIDVKKQGFFAFRSKKLLNNVRADGCQYFSTVLGPGYNYDHRDHFHFDLMERKNGRKACH